MEDSVIMLPHTTQGERIQPVGSSGKWEEAGPLMGRGEERQDLELGTTGVEGEEWGCEVG